MSVGGTRAAEGKGGGEASQGGGCHPSPYSSLQGTECGTLGHFLFSM